MKIDVKPANPSLLVQTRGGETGEIRAALDEIERDEELHNKLLTVSVYEIPAEEGKAQAHKQSLQNGYGMVPAISGWQFSVARSVDSGEEYLAVQYMPQEIVDGAWEDFQKEKKAKAQAARERAEARRIERELEDQV